LVKRKRKKEEGKREEPITNERIKESDGDASF